MHTHPTLPATATATAPDRRRPDRGVTLVELLVVVVLSGALVFSLTTAFLVVVRAAPQAEARLSESKDVTFLSAWLPVDLSTSVEAWSDHDEATVKSEMLAALGFTYTTVFPSDRSVNVLTLALPADGGGYEIVAYRYEEYRPGEWRVARYLISEPGQAGESISLVGVAYELPPPPAGWVPADGVGHAVEVTSRNQEAIRPVGEDITVTFRSGNEFTTGGASISSEASLDEADPATLPDPTAPPTRCGGPIALLIDTSGSVPADSGGVATEEAAIGFIEAFIGTPTEFSINGFDRYGYAMVADGANTESRAPFLSVLDDTDPNVDMMIKRIRDLDDLDGRWPGGGASIDQRDPNGDRIMWDQIGSGTNWEDGLYNVFFDASTGQPHNSHQPDLVVLITDGQPTMVGGPSRSASGSAVDAAAAIANEGRSQGTRIIGVIVGKGASNTSNLEQVVGSNEWTGSVTGDSVDVGNAVAADYFSGSFSDLGQVLRSIMIAECGGTVTIRKQLEDGSTPSHTQWNYSSPTGASVLDLDTQSSITFDFNFEDGAISQTVRITEESQSGYSFVGAECSTLGAPYPADDDLTETVVVDGVETEERIAGVELELRPDQAISCIMVSRRD